MANIRTLLFVVAAGALLAVSAPAVAGQQAREAGASLVARFGPEFTEPFTRTIQVAPNATLDLTSESGDVVVTGGSGTAVRIDAVKRVRQPSEAAARTLMQTMVIRVSETSDRVEVRTELPPEGNWSGGVDYTIAVPDTLNVTLRTARGDQRISNVRGELRATTVSGTIRASSVGKLRDARTVSGDIEITDASGEDVSASTMSGSVTVRTLKARFTEVDVKTGDVRFVDVESEQVYVSAVTGNVDFTGRLAKGGRYQLRSHGGQVTLTPVGEAGFDLEAHSFSGDIRSDFPLPNSPSPGEPNQTLRGTVGDASATVELRSFSGDVVIVKR